MYFEIVGTISHIETIARGNGMRELPRLRKIYGEGDWRKRKGVAAVRFTNGVQRQAEIHWYEANGIGKFEFKIKRFAGQTP